MNKKKLKHKHQEAVIKSILTCIPEMWQVRAKGMSNLLLNEIDFWRNLAEVYGIDKPRMKLWGIIGMKEKDDVKTTEMKLLRCYGQAQRMTDEGRPKIKAAAIPCKKKSTGTCKEILHEGVQMTVSNREQTAGQWVDRKE